MLCVQAVFRFAELSPEDRLPHLVSCFRALPSRAGTGASADTAFGGAGLGVVFLGHMAVVYVSLFSW